MRLFASQEPPAFPPWDDAPDPSSSFAALLLALVILAAALLDAAVVALVWVCL